MGSEGQSFGHINIEQLRAIAAKIAAMPRQPTMFITGTECYWIDELAANDLSLLDRANYGRIDGVRFITSENFPGLKDDPKPDWQRKKYFGNRGRKR